MKEIIFFLFLLVELGCRNPTYNTRDRTLMDSLYEDVISICDTSTDPCKKFKKQWTEDAYLESVSDRGKSCPADTLTHLIALIECDLALNINPNSWRARYGKASELLCLGYYEHAVQEFTLVIESSSREDDQLLYQFRGDAYYGMGKYEMAITDYNYGIKYIADKSYLYLMKAKAEWKLGMKDRACDDYKTAITLNSLYKNYREFILCE